MQRCTLPFFALLVVGTTAWAGSSQHEAKQWLERMLQAAQTLSYEGTFVYIQGQNVEVMRIAHSSAGDSGRQRMFALNGAEREVLVEGDKVTCLMPQQELAFSSSSFERSPLPISFPQELDELGKSYRFESLGDDRIAGHKTRIIGVIPRDDYRYGYRLWLEQRTGMVLRSALLDADNQVLEQLLFTDIRIKPEIDLTLLKPRNAGMLSSALSQQDKSGETVTTSQWQLSELPPGFEQIMHQRYPSTAAQDGDSTAYTEHMVFSDGLATISVFLDQRMDDPVLEGASQIDAMNAFGVVIEDYQVIAVGEVPSATVERIANSIEPIATAKTQ